MIVIHKTPLEMNSEIGLGSEDIYFPAFAFQLIFRRIKVYIPKDVLKQDSVLLAWVGWELRLGCFAAGDVIRDDWGEA